MIPFYVCQLSQCWRAPFSSLRLVSVYRSGASYETPIIGGNHVSKPFTPELRYVIQSTSTVLRHLVP